VDGTIVPFTIEVRINKTGHEILAARQIYHELPAGHGRVVSCGRQTSPSAPNVLSHMVEPRVSVMYLKGMIGFFNTPLPMGCLITATLHTANCGPPRSTNVHDE
jgi:hypothetical protein